MEVLCAFLFIVVGAPQGVASGSALGTIAGSNGNAQRSAPLQHIIVEVVLPNRRALDQLTAEGFIIDAVRGNMAVIYATPRQLKRLEGLGWQVTEVGRQPAPPVFRSGAKGLGVYHNYAGLTAELQAFVAAYPNLCRLYSLGRSVQGRELWAMLITDLPDIEEDEPEFKYIATMHGDEPIGAELCLYFIHRLLSSYGTDSRITTLVNDTAVWIVPLMNPDGLELGRRTNANGFDLNRSFPVYPTTFTGNIFDGEPLHDEGRPPEAAHVMRWTAANSFILSANFHAGELVVNYPYDEDGVPSGVNAPTPDDALFREVSLVYSSLNPMLWTQSAFPNGIVNGSAWYTVFGGMQDWNYRYVSCNEVTIEVSRLKRPPESELPVYWAANAESMLAYVEAVHMGVRGVVTDAVTGAPLWAKVEVEGNAHPVFTDPDVGDYHRMLLPGTYTLTFSAPGWQAKTVAGVTVSEGVATRLNVALEAGYAETDVNLDGTTNAADLQLVINKVLGLSVSYACDVNQDGRVDAVDIQRIVITILRR